MTEFEYFRDNYCSHQCGYKRFGDEKDPVAGCTYKNEVIAKSWEDWQPCNQKNCPFMRHLSEQLMIHYLQGRVDEKAEMQGNLMQAFSPDKEADK